MSPARPPEGARTAARSAEVSQCASPAQEAAERAARQSYGRLIAILSARTRDIAASEDALADAFARALERWPADGIPEQPEAWLLSVARNRLLDSWRHARVRDEAAQTLLLLADEVDVDTAGGEAVPDERLRLLFVCAHPAIDEAARTPLMLQTVLGLDAARMAGAFLTAPATLGQRLVRAKARIRTAGIPFEFPQLRDLPQRLQDVLDGIYAAYGTGWDDVDGTDAVRRLSAEAIELGTILCRLMPGEAEPLGLLALMLFCEARDGARRDAAGAYVPFDAQDIACWNLPMLAEAERALMRAAALAMPGPYQIEAAIQSAHTQRRIGADVPPAALVELYNGLIALRPSVGARVSRCCAVARADGVAAGLAALEALGGDALENYQPWWAARAHLLGEAGRHAEARAAYQRAIGLSTQQSIRNHLARVAAALG
ncbi:MAG: RNA polymerase subunit sigma-70 [Variovorax sp.]|nr:MAG: RNA polymerase subunit sigma-70 [Variovorax sp.]